MLQQQQQVNDYADYNDSSDGIGSSLSSSPAPSLTESTSSSNCSSPNKFTYSTPYTSVNTKSQLLNNNKSNEQYFQQQQQQSFNRYIPNQNYNQQLYNYQNYYTNINNNSNSFNDSCYQSKNNSFNRSYETQNTTKPVINSLSKFSIEAILAKPSNTKQNSISVETKQQQQQQHQEPIKEKGKRKKRASNNIDLEMSHNNKRIRTIFTQEQLDKLEIEFLKQQYMVGSERTYLAHSLNLTESQVKIWFQNRRIKWRKTTADEQAQEKVNKIDESEIINETNSNNTSTCSYDDE